MKKIRRFVQGWLLAGINLGSWPLKGYHAHRCLSWDNVFVCMSFWLRNVKLGYSLWQLKIYLLWHCCEFYFATVQLEGLSNLCLQLLRVDSRIDIILENQGLGMYKWRFQHLLRTGDLQGLDSKSCFDCRKGSFHPFKELGSQERECILFVRIALVVLSLKGENCHTVYLQYSQVKLPSAGLLEPGLCNCSLVLNWPFCVSCRRRWHLVWHNSPVRLISNVSVTW